MASLIGQVLDGKVKLLSLIGEGGMGAVYRGLQLNLEREVAVKLLKPQFLNSEDLVRRFYREAKAAGQLRTRHVVRIYDYGRVSEGAYIIMELSSGVSLASLLDQEGRLPQERAVQISAQILSGLAEAHGRGIIHRDLKTDNILIERDFAERDFALILDFGIAKLAGSQSIQTAAGSIFGTPSYMAPEQCLGEVADARTDLYAVGVMLFEMLAGNTPFGDRPPSQLLFAHIKEAPPDIGNIRKDMPRELAKVVMSLLAKNRDDRPPSAESARRRLLVALGVSLSGEVLGSFEDTLAEEDVDGANIEQIRERIAQGRVPSAIEISKRVPITQPSLPTVAPSFGVESTLPPAPTLLYVPKEAIDTIAKILTETLGPVATLVVNKELAQIVPTGTRLKHEQLDRLIERLCFRIKDTAKRAVFSRDVRAALAEMELTITEG